MTKLPAALQGLTSGPSDTGGRVNVQQVCDMHCSHCGPYPALTCVSWNRELLPTTALTLPSSPKLGEVKKQAQSQQSFAQGSIAYE